MGFLSALLHRGVTTDVIEILEAQHKEVDMIFESLEKGSGDRRALFEQLANLLAAHATVEEKIFYPAVMAKETSELLHESVEEHLAIKRVLADMLELRVDDDSFKAKLTVVKEQVSHHAHKEEEKKLFPKVKQLFTVDERAALGNELLVMFEELMRATPSANLPRETDVAAELPAAP
jgi:hemerythrin superfamily protein